MAVDLRFRILRWWANHGIADWSRQSSFRKISRYYDGMTGRSETRNGVHFDYRIGDPVDTSLAIHGRFEPMLTSIVIDLAKSHRTFIDVGCNLGYFTCLFAHHRPDARILSIDANPAMTARCQHNATINGLIGGTRSLVIDNTGVSNAPGTLRLGLERNRPSQASFGTNADSQDESMTVAVDTLSNLLVRHQLEQPEVLKVDIEGFEPACFQGLSPAHSRSLTHIFLEVAPSHLTRCGFTLNDLWSQPLWADFDLRLITDDATEAIDIAAFTRNPNLSGMLWAKRRPTA